MARERAEGHREFGAWEGDRGRLLAIAQAIEKACATQLEADLASEQATYDRWAQQIEAREQEDLKTGVPAADLEMNRGWRASELAEFRETLEKRSERARNVWTTHATAREKELDYRLSGPAHEVTDELDPRRVDSVEFQCPSGGSLTESIAKCEVSLSRQKGARVYVVGDDRDWVRATLATVGDEVARDVPPYAPLRHMGTGAMFGLVALVAIVAATTPTDGSLLALIIGVAAVTIPVGIIVHDLLINRMILPGFEILSGARRSRASRALTWFGGFVATGLVSAGIAWLTS